ncbi:Gfo/Idh/MocA family protein [Hamadaea tsunoensis]|uniref:Gfo/Idh/MocA family protein n=1 Tax=Hamadaea tsunoensis TaxID=53368 RepID=UPI0003FF652D|nr:Gfo/Idh/MocA family oxidoreductase [Hamadaea tsunoensis]
MAEKIRWGVLATGGIAATFTTDLLTLPDAEVVAVGSRTPAGAQAFADRFGIPRAYGSWQELADDPEVDIVYVATPHNAHFAAAELCLRAGKHVLCEKPFTINLAETLTLIDLARERELFLMEAMWMRTNPAMRRMLEIVNEGQIGEIKSVHADFHIPGPFAPEHRMRDPKLGGGALLDLGVYPVTFAHAVLGMPDAVTSWAAMTPEGVDETTGMVFGYDYGAVAALTCGMTSVSPVNALVSGTTGHVELGPLFFRPDAIRLHRAGEQTQVIDVPYAGNGMGHEAVEAMRCLREGLTESPLVTWQDSIEVMTLLDRVRAQIGVSYPGEEHV